MLPIANILDTVSDHTFTILTATPGSGKTTRLPIELLGVVGGKILVLEPRRVAAVSASTYAASRRGWTVGGDEIGYQVRFDSKAGPKTRLIYMTDALLLRRMVDDPELKGVDLVVIDEFHERNLNQDLILGAIKELVELGREIKLLVMSATLDTERLRRFLPGAAVIDVPGQVHPLEVRFADASPRPVADHAFCDRVAAAILAAEREDPGDILVFLPGVGEIARVGERLRGRSEREIVPLHGSLALTDQQRVLKASAHARVILSTNVAEASVTVPGVNFVIDGGLAKQMEMNPQTGFAALETGRIALFNARQRAGRAARQGPGTVLRLWTEFDEATMAEEPTPEVARADLSSALLWLAHLGVSDFAQFAWFDPPPAAKLGWAVRALKSLGAVDAQNRLTEFGRRLARFPLAPRLGALLARGDDQGIGTSAARLAAILNERDFADQVDTHANTECDMLLRLELLTEAGARNAAPIRETARQLERLVDRGEGDDLDVRRLLLITHADRLCRRRANSERARMVGGRGVRLGPRSQVRKSEFFVALQGMDLANQPDTVIHLASGFDKAFVLEQLKDRVRVEEDVYYEDTKAQFFARRRRYIEDLALDEPSLSPAKAEDVQAAFVAEGLARWDALFAAHPDLGGYLARARFLAHHEPSHQISAEVKREFLGFATFGKTKFSELDNLVATLESVLPTTFTKAMRDAVPATFLAPSGVRHPVLYDELHAAYVDIRLQELFGLKDTPKILFGRLPLTFRLLGPNYRPVQVTADLANFWRDAYVEVRKELRARYPKHAWPEDPINAKPEAKGRRR